MLSIDGKYIWLSENIFLLFDVEYLHVHGIYSDNQ